jgi:hypothetical protein
MHHCYRKRERKMKKRGLERERRMTRGTYVFSVYEEGI